MNLFYIQFTLTKCCNQSCHYCDLDPKFMSCSALQEFDLDRFKWTLNNLNTDNLFIELSGGEPGLVKNLPDAYRVLHDHPNVKRTQLMSNGLARINFPDLIREFDRYNEHLITDIEGHDIQKFYNTKLYYAENTRNIVVLTKGTTESILNNFDYFKHFGLFNENYFWLKNYVQRTAELDNAHYGNLIRLFNKIDSDYSRYSIEQLQQESTVSHTVCQMIGFQPVINVGNNTIQHCAYHMYGDHKKKELTNDNLELLLTKQLFVSDNPKYCENCHLYSRDYRLLLKKKANCDISN